MAERTRTLGWVILLLAVGSAGAADANFQQQARENWHQWRGPLATGASPTATPPTHWDAQTHVKWKVKVPGKGSSTPIIWNDRVFVTTAVETDRKPEGGNEQAAEPSAAEEEATPERGRGRRRRGRQRPTNIHEFAVVCYDRASGRQLWQRTVIEEVPHEAGHETNSLASSSPTTDGQRVYVSFGSRGVYCLDWDGNVVWNRDFGQMETILGFGEGSSAAIYNDTLVVPWDHEGDSFVTALDAATGEEKWKVARDEGTTWATPLIVEHGGRVQVVMNGSRRVRSYDITNGELVWECGGQARNAIPSPVSQEGHVYCMTGFRGYAIFAIPLDATGDITDAKAVAWTANDAAPYVPSPLLYRNQLYFTKSNNAILVSRDARSGEVLIDETRLPELDSLYASPVAADDRIYLVGRDGTALVLKHGSTFEVLATNRLGEPVDASPALVGNELYLRGAEHLYCIAQ